MWIFGVFKSSQNTVNQRNLGRIFIMIRILLSAIAGRMTTFLNLNCRGKMGQIKAFAVPRYYGWTTIDGSKSDKCSR